MVSKNARLKLTRYQLLSSVSAVDDMRRKVKFDVGSDQPAAKASVFELTLGLMPLSFRTLALVPGLNKIFLMQTLAIE